MNVLIGTNGLPLILSNGVCALPMVPEEEPTTDWDTNALVQLTESGGVYPLTYRGVTWNFSTPVWWFASANGDPIVVSHATYMPSGTTIVSVTPTGTTDADGYDINGLMINPTPTSTGGGPQGYDEGTAQDLINGQSISGQYIDYSAAVNADPGKTGSPISISTGESKSFEKSVRKAGVDPDTTWCLIEEYNVLTVMATLPPRAGTWFRPGKCGTTKAYPPVTLEEMELDSASAPPQLRDLAKPSGFNHPSGWVTEITNRKVHTPQKIWSTYGRRAQLAGDIGSSAGYSRDVSIDHAEYLNSLFIDPDTSGAPSVDRPARKTLGAILIQWGLDALSSPFLGGTGAGQYHGYHSYMILAAFMMQSQTLLDRALAQVSNVLGQYFWIEEQYIGAIGKWHWGSAGSNLASLGAPYTPLSLGKPEWVHQGPASYDLDRTNLDGLDGGDEPLNYLDASWNAPYKAAALFTTLIMELMPIALLRNGPGGISGWEVITRGSSVGPGGLCVTAAVPMMDRSFVATPVGINNNNTHNSIARAIYTAWRGNIVDQNDTPIPTFEYAPDIYANQYQWPVIVGVTEASRVGISAPGSGEVFFRKALDGSNNSFDHNHDYSQGAVTDIDVQVSVDAVQWIDPAVINAGNTFGSSDTSKTMVGFRPGTNLWFRWRQATSLGWSDWSQSWPQCGESGSSSINNWKIERGRVLTGGTTPSSGSPTFIVNPAICYKQFPLYNAPYYEPAPANLGDAEVYKADAVNYGTYAVETLYAGVGYLTGGSGNPVFDYNDDHSTLTVSGWTVAYQWQRDTGGGFGNISGATGQSLDITGEASGTDLRCVVTVNSVAANSNAVTVP